ncbi:MAG: type II secretion system protein GspL [Pseudomonadota bacterium]
MTDALLIWPAEPDGEALLLRRDGTARRGTLEALAADAGPNISAILPGQQVRSFLTDVPDKVRGADRTRVARFAHEDRIAAPLDTLHVVVGAGDPAPTLMVARADMDAVLAVSDSVHIYADFDALGGLGSDTESGPVRLLGRVVTPGLPGEAVDADWSDVPGRVLDDASLARALFSHLDANGALDLRTGPYRRRLQWQAGPWGRVAAGLLACAALGTVLSLADARATQAQADALGERARALYTQATGEAAPANIARAVRRTAPADADPGAFLALSDALFGALSEHPGIRIERLSFDGSENALRLRLVYPDFEAAGALERSVAARGAAFATGGVREQNGRYVGDAAFQLEGTT